MSQIEFLESLKSATLFMKNILGIDPFDYQVEILEDNRPKVIIVGGRQIGKSLTLSAKALWNAFVKPDQDIIIVSKNLRQAKIVFDHVHRYVSNNEFISKHTKKLTIHEIRFDNGSVIRCLPAGKTGDGIRGFSTSMVIFDEAAFIPDEVYTSVEPALAVKGKQVIYSSTPFGRRGYFYSLYADEMSKPEFNRKASIYVIPSLRSPKFSKDFLEQERRIKTSVQIAQEYEAQFVDETGMLFPFGLIYSCTDDYEYSFPRVQLDGVKYYLGVDVAYSGEDDTALILLSVNPNGTRKVEYIETMSKAKVIQVVGRIANMARSIQFTKVYVDKTGVGAGVYDLLKTQLGSIVYGLEFSESVRDKIYTNLKIALEQRKVILNRNDQKMLYQFSSYTVKYDVTGKLRINKDVTMHDDLVDALALCFYDMVGYQIKVLEKGFEVLPNPIDNRPFVSTSRWIGLETTRRVKNNDKQK